MVMAMVVVNPKFHHYNCIAYVTDYVVDANHFSRSVDPVAGLQSSNRRSCCIRILTTQSDVQCVELPDDIDIG